MTATTAELWLPMRNALAGGLVPALLLATAYASAAQFTCFPLQPGENPAAAARRLTGEAWAVEQPWFQIFNPATSSFVDKTAYGRVVPGWRACVATDRIRPSLVAARRVASQTGGSQPLHLDGIREVAARPELWWGLSVLLTMFLASEVATTFSPAMRGRAEAMTAFGERFVREFERPLLRPVPGDRAVDARLHVDARARQLDIRLKPRDGRLYPNLTDHKANVEYDVGRVLRVLGDTRFAPQRLSADGPWVIVRCRIASAGQLEGGK